MILKQVLKRNLIYFFISFFSAGAVNMIPQLFFSSYYPEQKGLYLSVTLILSSIAAFLGIAVSGKLLEKADKTVTIMFVVFTVGFASLAIVPSAVGFILMIILTSFTCNYVYNYLDNKFLNHIQKESLDGHIKVVLAYQMTGYIVSPLFFSEVGHNQIISIGVILSVALLVAFFSYPNIKPLLKTETVNKAEMRFGKRGRLSMREWFFAAYLLSFMMGAMIALSIMVYILSDYYKLADYGLKGGIAMCEIIVLSGLTVALMPKDKAIYGAGLEMEQEWRLFHPWLNLLIVVLFMTTIILLALRLQNSFAYILLAVAPSGCSFGYFIKLSRSYASNIDLKNESSRLLSIYNNLQNISGAAGYCVILLCWMISEKLSLNYLKLTIAGIMCMLMVSIIFIVMWVIAFKREKAKLV